MKHISKDRLLLAAQVAILAAQVLGIGFASVGRADRASDMTILVPRAEILYDTAAYRDEIQARARVVVWKTRFDARSNLVLKLDDSQPSAVRLAGIFTGKSG